MRAALCILLVSVMLAGCSADKSATNAPVDQSLKDSMSEVRKSMESAVGNITEKAAAASKEQLGKQIDLLKTEFERQQKALGEKAETMTGEAQTKLREALKDLESKQGELTKKWEAFSKDSGQAASEMAAGLAKAMSEFRDALAKASSEFRKAEAETAAETPKETEGAETAPKPQ